MRWTKSHRLQPDPQHPEVGDMIESFRLAYRMQSEVPDVLDMGKESAETLELYGIGKGDGNHGVSSDF